MYKLAARIRELYQNDAVHRKGFRIRAATPELAAANAVEEVGELMVELVLEQLGRINKPEAKEDELADVLAVVVHLAMMVTGEFVQNYGLASDESLAALEQRAIGKINIRFKDQSSAD